ncbi:hypothetical protein ABVK25_007721 [Lepraria finkii]|uniref:NACHT domain-containing protein n=1 Tax=Lepraria finkii TaxID=1340010 RepID=A0ABR4B2D8_9LECA
MAARQRIEGTKFFAGSLRQNLLLTFTRRLADNANRKKEIGSSRAPGIRNGGIILHHLSGYTAFQALAKLSCVVEETRAFCSRRDSYYVAYYHFTFSDTIRQKTTTLLRSMLLYAGYEGDQPREAELMNALKSLLEANGRVYFIIDALDECPHINGERAKFVTVLDTLKIRSRISGSLSSASS